MYPNSIYFGLKVVISSPYMGTLGTMNIRFGYMDAKGDILFNTVLNTGDPKLQ